ncbi:hypothetical protein AMS68_005779 [Peltaster fructicola]|uniref:F-box domain-containing protein n=1 Tax=Peltaster fructicola TaxID=286661 RepID=A0A6H0XZQ8_9PEZI|nr:hypothetical protein AMS68_005779 [Peltaster fructicola]
MSSARNSRNIAEIRRAQIHGAPARQGEKVFASLRATQIVTSKPVLPAELIAAIIEYVPVPDLMRCARVSRQLKEIVYDDSRWIGKLIAMRAWKENEAKQYLENAMKKKAEAQKARHNEVLGGQATNAARDIQGERKYAEGSTVFDAGREEEKLRRLTIVEEHRRRLPEERSIRGRALHEFGKVYMALGPLYRDLANAQSHSDPAIFRVFQNPEDQAQILSSLQRFSRHDSALGSIDRQAKIASLIEVFERAVLREFEHGLVDKDIDGRMKRYAHVLTMLNGGHSGVEVYISSQPLLHRTLRLIGPLQCLEDVAPGHVDLNASQRYFQQLSQVLVEQADIINRVFPSTVDAYTPLLQRVCKDILADWLTTLFDEAHSRGLETYVKAVSGTFAHALQLVASLTPIAASPENFTEIATHMITACYEKHVDLYLAEELALFKNKSNTELDHWEKEALEQQATAESYFMSNVSRQAAKRDFLSSFKKVVMMPVNTFSAPFASAKPANRHTVDLSSVDTTYNSPALTGTNTPKRSSTPRPDTLHRSTTPRPEAPTSELAAKTAIMNSRLEGIKSLFSIEVALNLTHSAKASLERAAIIVEMGGKHGNDARQQCEIIFIELVHILGTRHVKAGFDKAVEHLGTYDPRQVREYRAKLFVDAIVDNSEIAGVEPLMTFLELVNVGDLIQQMIDVFYNQELLAKKLTEHDDFLDPAVKEKKRFEQMLDERVAAGLSKGIDVLMSEVEFLCATTQPATDFNPEKTAGGMADLDIGPSPTAKAIIDIVSSHTSMLVGSTDKTMLDVFMQEVGLRLFGVLCKHIKRQRISVDGSIKLISDVNHYSQYITSLRQKAIQPYFSALRELGQIYLVHIDPPSGVFSSGTGKDAKRGSILSMKASKTQLQAKELATIIADNQRYYGIFPAEEVYEFAERRADWYLVKSDVERAMYGAGCSVM